MVLISHKHTCMDTECLLSCVLACVADTLRRPCPLRLAGLSQMRGPPTVETPYATSIHSFSKANEPILMSLGAKWSWSLARFVAEVNENLGERQQTLSKSSPLNILLNSEHAYRRAATSSVSGSHTGVVHIAIWDFWKILLEKWEPGGTLSLVHEAKIAEMNVSGSLENDFQFLWRSDE